MTTYTIYSFYDLSTIALGSVWNTVREAAGSSSNFINFTQTPGVEFSSPNYIVAQLHTSFDTSTVPAGTPDAITYSFVQGAFSVAGSLTWRERSGRTFGAAAHATATALASLDVVASRSFSAGGGTNTRFTMSGPADVPRQTDYTITAHGDKQMGTTAPTSDERVRLLTFLNTGTADDPYLEIVMPPIEGDAAITLENITLAAASVVNNPPAEGTLAVTLSALTTSAIVTRKTPATAAITLADFAIAATATVELIPNTPARRSLTFAGNQQSARTLTLSRNG